VLKEIGEPNKLLSIPAISFGIELVRGRLFWSAMMKVVYILMAMFMVFLCYCCFFLSVLIVYIPQCVVVNDGN